jgi:hypothetical protein
MAISVRPTTVPDHLDSAGTKSWKRSCRGRAGAAGQWDQVQLVQLERGTMQDVLKWLCAAYQRVAHALCFDRLAHQQHV